MTDDKLTSALPENFETFAEQMEPAKPKRRRSTPAVKPKESKPSKKKRPTAADVAGVGGMEKTKWAGMDMWRCKKCHGTTFKEAESRVHQCKQVKFADEEGLSD
jgi:hypothetical protein